MPKTCTTLLTILLTLLSASLAAAPIAYSINSDSGTVDEDSLYRIDLATGVSTRIASLTPEKLDVEGLAFAPNGTLYAIDDESLTLFTLDPNTAVAGTPKLISGLSVVAFVWILGPLVCWRGLRFVHERARCLRHDIRL